MKRGRPTGAKNIFPSDVQRERLYKAEQELELFDTQEFQTREEVEALILRLMKRKVWTKRSHVNRLNFYTNGRSWAHGTTYGKVADVTLPKWAWNRLVIAHELAHVMCPPNPVNSKNPRAAHGREFAGTYLYLCGILCGKDVQDKLKREFFLRNVDWDSRLAS